MSIVYLTSASGSPGVSTLAAGIAVNWPRPSMLLEADISRASQVIPGLFNARYSHQNIGLTEANVASMRGQLTAELLHRHTIAQGERGRYVVPGFNDLRGGQSTHPSFWAALTRALYDFPEVAQAPGLDVIVDGGRYQVGDPRDALMASADTILLVTGNTLPDLAAAHTVLPHMHQAVQAHGRQPDVRIVVAHGPHRSPYGTSEVQGLLEAPVLVTMPWDPKAAARFSHGTSNYSRKGPFATALLKLITDLDTLLAERRYSPQNG